MPRQGARAARLQCATLIESAGEPPALPAGPQPHPNVLKTSAGWHFDTAAGKEEIIDRRVGRNELATIQVCLAYSSGVMTFIVNQDGVVFEKDLGPKSAAVARAMTVFNPDKTWNDPGIVYAATCGAGILELQQSASSSAGGGGCAIGPPEGSSGPGLGTLVMAIAVGLALARSLHGRA